MKPWPPIDEVDRRMVLASLDQGNHTYGPNCVELEKEFAAWNGNRHAVTCNSGTAALHMCLAACQCGVGDEVIVPAYTWPSSATCCLHHNVVPVFVDIDWRTMNIDPAKIAAAITPRTRAIIAVHLHGLSADMDGILAVARAYGLKVIEDGCQSHGATFRGRKVGTMGHCAAFSTNQNKCFSSGEGGFFVTDDDELLALGKTLWYFGENRAPDASATWHTYGMGWMYRNNDLTAAFGRAQLTKLDGYLAQQKANVARLAGRLAKVPGLLLPEEPAGYGHTWYNYTVRFDLAALGHAADAAAYRDRIVSALRAEGADVGVWQGWPVPQMTVFQAKNAYGRGCPWSCPHAGAVDYSLDQFPMARRHSDWHVGMTTPLRAPNGPDLADLVADAFRKVMTNLAQLGD
jgi:dTDP-4-amino-4,6-dideoxygalactose transaminase